MTRAGENDLMFSAKCHVDKLPSLLIMNYLKVIEKFEERVIHALTLLFAHHKSIKKAGP